MRSTGRWTDELLRLKANSYDVCQSCGAKIPTGVAANAGYKADDTPLYVGACCSSQIDELASPVNWWLQVDKRCPSGTKLWRYMEFAKFVALLEKQGLYFPRADKLGDPFEGAAGIAQRQDEWDLHYLNFFREALRNPPGQTRPSSEEDVRAEAQRLLESLRAVGARNRKTHFVNCWHANTGESEALWRLYCPPPSMGIALCTTAELLTSCLSNPRIEIGYVQYMDFRTAFADTQDRMFYKRKSLSHEAEVRAVLTLHHEQQPTGTTVPVDLEKLLLSVVPSPFAPDWFPRVVEATMDRFGVQAKLVQSELLSQPFFSLGV